ncbi:MAG: TAXI family TRAP transporter solute-binding subunit [Deltaproteobacteria bacterium]|nr:TAXI family TRAP transporter solute-binding subunit [Deltaproteobacteria bacterium]
MTPKKHAKYIGSGRLFKRALIICAFLIVGLFPFSAHALDILFGTGEAGTFSHFTGRTICRIMNRHSSDMNCKTVPATGDVHILTNLQDGALDIGLIDSRMLYDAMDKTGYFEFLDIRYDNLRALVPLYDVPVTLVVRKDAKITSLDTLKGKRLNAGAPRSQQHLAVDTIMKVKNWSEKDFSLFGELPGSQSQDTMAFCHGTIQAMVHIGVHPDSSLQQLFKLCKAGLVDMDDSDIEKLIMGHPAFIKISGASDTYPSHPKGVTTFGTRVMLVASADLDEETVYKIMDAIYSNQKNLMRAHPALSSLTVDASQIRDIGIALHPGAVKYLSDH